MKSSLVICISISFLVMITSCVSPKKSTQFDENKCIKHMDYQYLVDWSELLSIKFQIDTLNFMGNSYPSTELKTIQLNEGLNKVQLNENFIVSFTRIPAIEFQNKVNLLEYDIFIIDGQDTTEFYNSGLSKVAARPSAYRGGCHSDTMTATSEKYYIRVILKADK